MSDVVDAEESHLVPGVVGLGGDGELFVGVHLDGGKVGGGLDGRRGVIAGKDRRPRQCEDGNRNGYDAGQRRCLAQIHREKLYQDGRQNVEKG